MLIPNSYEAKARLFVQMSSILQGQIGVTSEERQSQLLRLKQTLTSNENDGSLAAGGDLAHVSGGDYRVANNSRSAYTAAGLLASMRSTRTERTGPSAEGSSLSRQARPSKLRLRMRV